MFLTLVDLPCTVIIIRMPLQVLFGFVFYLSCIPSVMKAQHNARKQDLLFKLNLISFSFILKIYRDFRVIRPLRNIVCTYCLLLSPFIHRGLSTLSVAFNLKREEKFWPPKSTTIFYFFKSRTLLQEFVL